MLRFASCLVLAGLVLFVPGVAWGARPVARILAVQGDVTIERSEESTRPAQTFGTVYEDEKLIVGQSAQVVLAFRSDGRMERLGAGAKVTVTKAGCMPREAVEAVETPKPRQAAVAGAIHQLKPLSQAGVIIVRSVGGSSSPPPRVSPIVGATVLSTRPEFTWPAVEGAQTYEVAVTSGGRTLWSERTAQTRAPYGAKTALRDGVAYHWTVRVVAPEDAAGPVAEGEFAVASDGQRGQAEAMIEMAAGDDPATVALAVAWLDENGLAAEALAACERLARLQPEAAPVQAYLYELYSRAGRGEEAEKARAAFLRLRPPPPRPPWFRSIEKKAKGN